MKFTYDPAGRMTRREDQKGDTVTFNHTMAGTITSRNYRTKANSPSGTIADSDTFTFDNLGRMLTAVSGRYSNTVTMTYDSYGRLKDESLTIASQTYTVTRAYDTRSRLTQLTYPNGSIVQRTYTTRSQLHTVKYLGTTVDTRTYDDGGRLGTSTYANGAVVSFAYRNDNLPTSIATTHAGSPNIGTYRKKGVRTLLCKAPEGRVPRKRVLTPFFRPYTWDANKNKTGETITSTMSGFGFSTGATGYDDEDRLQTWNRTNGTMNQAWTLSAVGNWNNFTSAGSTWNRTHSNAHEFTGFTGASTGTLAYDVKGNQTSRPSTLSAPALNLDWNFDNQLRGADTNGSAGSLEVTFEYDALGRRVSRSHSSGNVVYVHAGQQVIADYARGTAAASPSYRYVYADYVDEPIVRHTGTATTLPTTGDNALYYHRNQQYSIIGLTNAAGTLVERYSYTAYGTLGIYAANGTVRTSSTYANRYTYTGREYDADLALYHFRARWYDPATGGFISRDPLGFVDGMSLYRGYFGVANIDPLGKEVWIVVRAFGSESCGAAILNNTLHITGHQSHFYLVVKRADGRYYSLSFHPECWANGMWDANRESKSRIWCNDPKDLMDGSLNRLLYAWYPIDDALGKEEELIQGILTWGLENGVGFEIGAHKKIGTDPDGVMQTEGSLYSRPNTDWNDGRLDCPYQVGATNCAGWSLKMLRKCNISVKGVSLDIGRLNLGVGSTVQLPSTDQIEHAQKRTVDWGGYMFDWREFVNSVCPRGGFYVGP